MSGNSKTPSIVGPKSERGINLGSEASGVPLRKIPTKALFSAFDEILDDVLEGATRHHRHDDRTCQYCEGCVDAMQRVNEAVLGLVSSTDDRQKPAYLNTSWTFKAMPGNKGGVITRLPDGRIGFFDRASSLTNEIKPGDLVHGQITKVKARVGFVMPHKIAGEFEYLLDDGMPLPKESEGEKASS